MRVCGGQAYAGARPTHAEWQGKVYHRGGAVTCKGRHYPDFESSTGYGTGDGLCGWNCRHNFYPHWPGLSERNYTDAELAALNEKCVAYNGRMYTKYEISQMQRAAERKVRTAKRKYLAEREAGLDAAQAAVQLRTARQQLRQFIRDTGGQAESARTSVAGFGRSEAGRAAWAAKRTDRSYGSLHFENQPVTMASITNVSAFRCETLDLAGSRSLQNAHKRLLTLASKQPLGIEVGRAYKLDMQPLTKELIGPESGGSIYIPDQDVAYIAVHTHPDCNIFSPGDLMNFAMRSNLKMLTAVGHDGHVYAIEKNTDYEDSVVFDLSVSLRSSINSLTGTNEGTLKKAEQLIRDCIKEMCKNGVNFYE